MRKTFTEFSFAEVAIKLAADGGSIRIDLPGSLALGWLCGAQSGALFEQTRRWRRKFGIPDRSTVPSEKDGVHHRKSAAHAEDETEKEPNSRADKKVHSFDDVTPFMIVRVCLR